MTLFLPLIFSLLVAFSDAQPTCGAMFHASCELSWVVGSSCANTKAFVKANIQNCCVQKTIAKPYTNYTLTGEGSNWLSGTHGFTDGYVDMVVFKFQDKANICAVNACSQSLSLSVYDYCANYCNVRNIIRGIAYPVDETIGSCSYVPQEDATCPAVGDVPSPTVPPRDKYCDNQ